MLYITRTCTFDSLKTHRIGLRFGAIVRTTPCQTHLCLAHTCFACNWYPCIGISSTKFTVISHHNIERFAYPHATTNLFGDDCIKWSYECRPCPSKWGLQMVVVWYTNVPAWLVVMNVQIEHALRSHLTLAPTHTYIGSSFSMSSSASSEKKHLMPTALSLAWNACRSCKLVA